MEMHSLFHQIFMTQEHLDCFFLSLFEEHRLFTQKKDIIVSANSLGLVLILGAFTLILGLFGCLTFRGKKYLALIIMYVFFKCAG